MSERERYFELTRKIILCCDACVRAENAEIKGIWANHVTALYKMRDKMKAGIS